MISVIISAHDRKQYVMSAVKSVISQEFARDRYEIIVVKNFLDSEMDTYLHENAVESLYTEEKSLARKMVVGFMKSRGEILCFLDDDDLYSAGKLKTVSEYFSHGNLSFLHDSIVPVNESGKPLGKLIGKNPGQDVVIDGGQSLRTVGKALRYNADWYTSSMSVSRKLFESIKDEFWRITRGIDKYLFFTALSRGERLVVSSKELTMYRVHDSLTTFDVPLEMFLRQKGEFYKNSLDSARLLYSNSMGARYPEATRCNLIHAEMLAAFFSSDGHCSIGLIFSGARCYFTVGNPSLPRWIALCLMKNLSRKAAWRRYYNYYRKTYLEQA